MTVDAFIVLKEKYRKVALMGALSLGVIVLLFGVVIYIRSLGPLRAALPAFIEAVRIVFFMASIGQLMLIPYIQGRMMAAKGIEGVIHEQAEIWPGYVDKLYRAALVTYGLCLIPAFLGFSLYLITRQMSDFSFLAALAFINFVFYYPRYSQWEFRMRDFN